MDSHSYYVSTSPGILVAIVDTTAGVRLAKDQLLTHTFAPSTEKANSSLGSESPYLSTARLRSPSTISSSSTSSSVSDEEVQQHNRAAAFNANIDRAYSSIQRVYSNVQRAYGRKVMCITNKITQVHWRNFTSQIVVVPMTPNPYHRQAQKWRQALVKKRKAMLEILEAQRVIEEVEAEAREHIPTETIARVCSEFYRVDDFSTDERRFITTIANAALTIPVCTSTWDWGWVLVSCQVIRPDDNIRCLLYNLWPQFFSPWFYS